MTPAVSNERLRAAAEAFCHREVGEIGLRLSQAGPILIDPQHSVSWRIKSDEAIRSKLLRLNANDDLSKLNDYIGIRVIASHLGALDAVESVVKAWAISRGLEPKQRLDYFTEIRPGGYRAIHLNYDLHTGLNAGEDVSASVEIQLTTWLQHIHGLLSHQLFYKTEQSEPGISASLRSLSDAFHDLDAKIAEIASLRGQ